MGAGWVLPQEQLAPDASGALASTPPLPDATTTQPVDGALDGNGMSASSSLPAAAGLVYVCNLCNITATSQENLQAHFSGAQHKWAPVRAFHLIPIHSVRCWQVECAKSCKASLASGRSPVV